VGPIGLVPAGERWPDGTLRVAAEDAIGVGAIAAALQQGDATAAQSEQGHPAATRDRHTLSPEAELAVAQFAAATRRGLLPVLSELASGRELIAGGYAEDVRLAADLDVSQAVPRLVDGVLQG
jgi:2-phosphosulfolactate phosphatase